MGRERDASRDVARGRADPEGGQGDVVKFIEVGRVSPPPSTTPLPWSSTPCANLLRINPLGLGVR